MEEVDIVVHAPVYEGFGIVVLEAMAAGRPVVVNDAPGGLKEIVVPGTTGLMVPSNQPEALASALATLVTNPNERQRMGENGRLNCERRFSAQRMAERVAMSYETLLERRQRGFGASMARRLFAPKASQHTGRMSGNSSLQAHAILTGDTPRGAIAEPADRRSPVSVTIHHHVPPIRER
jgi:hypothetical protein